MRVVHLTIFIQFYFTLTRGSNSRECIAECLNKQYEYEYEYSEKGNPPTRPRPYIERRKKHLTSDIERRKYVNVGIRTPDLRLIILTRYQQDHSGSAEDEQWMV